MVVPSEGRPAAAYRDESALARPPPYATLLPRLLPTKNGEISRGDGLIEVGDWPAGSGYVSRGPPVRAAWLRPKQTDLVPGEGQFRSRFPQSAQLRLSDNNFSGSPQPTPISSQRNTSGRAGWKRAGPGCYDAVAIARAAGFPNAGYEPHPSCGPLAARSRPKRAAKISRKIVAGQQ